MFRPIIPLALILSGTVAACGPPPAERCAQIAGDAVIARTLQAAEDRVRQQVDAGFPARAAKEWGKHWVTAVDGDKHNALREKMAMEIRGVPPTIPAPPAPSDLDWYDEHCWEGKPR